MPVQCRYFIIYPYWYDDKWYEYAKDVKPLIPVSLILCRLNLSGQIQFTKSYTMESATDDTTHYAPQNELFARLPLESNLSEDTVQGRILLQYVNFALLTTSIQQIPDQVGYHLCSILTLPCTLQC